MALLSLKKLPGIAIIGGGVLYGRPFLTMVWMFLTEGVPTVWRNHVQLNPYYRAFRNGTWIAVVLPIYGLTVGLLLARVHIGMGQGVIYIFFVLSFLILGALLFLVDTFAAISIELLPEDERTEEALHNLRVGIKKYVQTILAFELFAALSFVVLGVYAVLGVVAAVALALAAYYQVSSAYDRPVTWAPGFMMNTSITAVFVMVILVALSLLPATRPYMLAVGINPTSFLHGGVIGEGKLSAAEKASRKKEREICDAEIAAIRKSIEAIDATKDGARTTKAAQDKKLAEKKKSCIF